MTAREAPQEQHGTPRTPTPVSAQQTEPGVGGGRSNGGETPPPSCLAPTPAPHITPSPTIAPSLDPPNHLPAPTLGGIFGVSPHLMSE